MGVYTDGSKVSNSPFVSLSPVNNSHSWEDTYIRRIFNKSTEILDVYYDFMQIDLTGWPLEV